MKKEFNQIVIFCIIFIVISAAIFVNLTSHWSSLFSRDESSQPSHTISSIYLYLPIETTEVEQIDYSIVKQKLTAMNYTFLNITNISANSSYLIDYRATYPKNIIPPASPWIKIDIVTEKTNGRKVSYISLEYATGGSQNSVESEKDYVKYHVNEIAQASNLTIDWSEAKWTISYAD